jgi:hypothetical protein
VLGDFRVDLEELDDKLDTLLVIAGRLEAARARVSPVRFRLTFNVVTLEGADMLVNMTDVQKFGAAIAVTDARGNPAAIDGVPEWSTSEETVLTVEPAADGLSAVVRAAGTIGVGQVVVSLDADLGDGVRPLTGVLDVSVVASEATAVGFAVTAPEAA